MNALASLGDAFVSVCRPTSLLLMATGVAVGIIFGSVPGPSAAMAVVLLLPLIFNMAPSMGMNLLVVVYAGGISGGLASAILLDILGTASSVAACFDGHSVTENGEVGRILGYGIVFSFLGSAFSLLVLTLCAPLLAGIALKFIPAENFGISFFALTTVAVLAPGSVVKGVPAGMLGLTFALVGMAPIDGASRSTFRSNSLMVGFDTLPALIDIFVISEILVTVESTGNGKAEAMEMKPIKGSGFTWKELVYQIPNATRSVLIGAEVGTLPGIGGSTSGMLSYVTAKNIPKYPDEFDKGCPDGTAATETVDNAVIGETMIPLLVLGIPGDDVTAMMLGGFLTHGLPAGPLLFVKNTDVVYNIFAACILCSLFMLVIEFLRIRGFVQLFGIPEHILMLLTLVPRCVGAYTISDHIFDVQSIILFGAMGYLYHKFRLPTTPFVFCLLIGEMVEIYLRCDIMQYKSFGAFFERSIFDVFFFVTIAVVVWFIHKE